MAQDKAKKKAYLAEWHIANIEKVKAKAVAWHKANEEKVKAYRVVWCAANIEKVRAQTAAYRNANAGKLKAQKSAKYRANPEKMKTRVAAWAKANPDRVRGYRSTRRARKAHAAVNDFTAQQWREMQALYDHRCSYCHRRCKGKLTQDHIQPLSKGGNHTFKNIVPSCRSCNSQKATGPVLKPVQPLLLL